MNKIKYIIVDVGGVLVRTTNLSGRHKWEGSLGLRRGAITRAVFSKKAGKFGSTGKISSKQIWQDVGEKLRLNTRDLNYLKKDFFAGDELNKIFYSYIKKLHKEYNIVILSDAWDNVRKVYTEVYHLDELVDEMIISAETGFRKPGKKLFKVALDYLGAKPEEVLFIDDKHPNIKGAKALGMKTIHFKHTKPAIEAINKALGRT